MLFYDTELGYTITGAWGLRKLRSSGYTGPVVRIRDTTGGAEQDVGFDPTTGELASFTVTGNAAVTTIYDQSGNGNHLVQATSGLQPLLKLNQSGNGKPLIEFDGVDDFMRDTSAASTSLAYLVASPVVIGMYGTKQPREQWGKFWSIPHADGANSTPFARMCIENDSASGLAQDVQLRIDAVVRTLKMKGWNNHSGWSAHCVSPHLGRFLQAGTPAETFTADSTTTYPNNTRLYIGANGQGTENNGMYFSELVFMSTSSSVEATLQAFIDKVGYDRLIGPNRFYRMTTTGSFDTIQTDGGYAEIEFRYTAGGADQGSPNLPIWASKNASGEQVYKGVDDTAGTWFSSGNSPAVAPVQYFMLGANTKIGEVYILTRNDSFFRYTVKKYIMARFMPDGTWDSAAEVDNTSEGNVASQTYTDTIVWTDPEISTTFTFDYSIPAYSIQGNYTFDYVIVQDTVVQTYTFDYRLDGQINFNFDYAIDLVKTFTFNYKILQTDGDLLGYLHVAPGVTSSVKRAFQPDQTGHTIDQWDIGIPGNLTYPESVPLPDQETFIHDTFYSDYYNRIWVSPENIRLSNPKIGFEYSFYVWNAYDRPNDLINYVPTDVDGTTFVEFDDMPITFGPIEFRTLHFTIDADAPSQIEGNMFFEFEMGGDGFDLFALVLGVLKTLPNEPFNEVWSWYSIMEISRNGTEQRQALRDQPRTQAGYEVMILDDEDRLTAYQQLFSFATRSVLVPFFQYTTQLTADVEEGDTRLYFDLSKSDIRADEYLVLFHPQTYQYQLVQVSTLNADGVNLLTPITFDADMVSWEVVPGRSMRLPNKSALGMGAIDGKLTFKGESTVWRDLVRPGNAVTLEEYDGYPVLPYKPIAQNDVDETFDSDVEVIDNDAAPPVLRSTYTNPFIESTKQYLIDREIEMDWWREFFDYTKGMLRPFLVPTWRDDLPLAEQPGLGDNEIITTNTDYADYFAYATYGWVQIKSDTGVLYRKVSSVEVDLLGLRLSLDDAIGLTTGSNENMVVSFLNLTRLNSDEVQLNHFINHTIIQVETRTVNQ